MNVCENVEIFDLKRSIECATWQTSLYALVYYFIIIIINVVAVIIIVKTSIFNNLKKMSNFPEFRDVSLESAIWNND